MNSCSQKFARRVRVAGLLQRHTRNALERNGHVRQLVDSFPYKEEVRGSSPFVPTSFYTFLIPYLPFVDNSSLF